MPQSVARPTKPCRLESEIVQNPPARPAVCRIASRPRRSRAIKAELGIRLAVVVHPGCTNSPVHPGCTNLGLSTLLFSRTNADHDGRVGCSQARAKAEPNSSTAGVHSRTDIRRTHGEYQYPGETFRDHGYRRKQARMDSTALRKSDSDDQQLHRFCCPRRG